MGGVLRHFTSSPSWKPSSRKRVRYSVDSFVVKPEMSAFSLMLSSKRVLSVFIYMAIRISTVFCGVKRKSLKMTIVFILVVFWAPSAYKTLVPKRLKRPQLVLSPEEKELLPCGRLIEGEHTCGDKNDEVLDRNRERLERFTAENKLNASETRDKILEIVFKEKKHFSIQDMVSIVKSKFPEIGFATIYRNVALFLEATILTEAFTNSKGITFYELNREVEHDHVQCLDCNKIFEYRLPKVDLQVRRTVANLAFREPVTRNVVYAHCDLIKKNT